MIRTLVNESQMIAVKRFAKYLIILFLIQMVINMMQLQSDLRWFSFDDGPGRNSEYVNAVPRFSDFFQIAGYASLGDPYEFTRSGYPPFAHALLAPFPNIANSVKFIFMVGFSLSTIYLVLASSLRVNFLNFQEAWPVVVISISFPVAFAIDRGNLDLFVLALLAIAVIGMERDSRLWPEILLGAAIAIKLYPVLLIFYFLRAKNGYRRVIFALLFALMLTIFSMMYFEIFSADGFRMLRLSIFPVDSNVLEPSYGSWSTSVTGLVAALRDALAGFVPIPFLDNLMLSARKILLLCSIAGFIIGIFVVKSRSNVLLICVISAMLIPNLSYHYKAGLLLLPLIASFEAGDLFLLERKAQLLLAISMGPTVWWYFGRDQANISSIITVICLFMLFAKVLYNAFESRNPRLKSDMSGNPEVNINTGG